MTVPEEETPVRHSAPEVDIARIVGADFVSIRARVMPDSLVTAGIIARFCREQGIPFHVKPVRTTGSLRESSDSAGNEHLRLHVPTEPADTTTPLCYRVHQQITEHGTSLDPYFTLAGILASDYDPADVAPSLLEASAAQDADGIATPTTDWSTGLAASTLHHADYSGDPDATQSALDSFGISTPSEATKRELASFAAVTNVTSSLSTAQSAVGLDRFLEPTTIKHPYQSLGGYSDIIRVLSSPSPGRVISLALPDPAYDAIRSSWQTHATQAHQAIKEATITSTGHYRRADVQTDHVITPARLLSYHAPESIVFAANQTHIALNTRTPPVPPSFTTAANATDGTTVLTNTTGLAVIPDGYHEEFFTAFTENHQ